MLLFGKTQKKHPGDLTPTVPDLLLHPLNFGGPIGYTVGFDMHLVQDEKLWG